MTFDDPDRRNLVVRPASAVTPSDGNTGSVLARMTGNALAIARANSELEGFEPLSIEIILTLDEETKIISAMSRLFRVAAKMGMVKFKEAARFIMESIRKRLPDAADKLSIEHFQAGYINIANEIGGDKREAMDFDSLDELMSDGVASTIDPLDAQVTTRPGALGPDPVFNDEIYAEAKPLFAEAIADFREAEADPKIEATDVREVVVAIVRGLVANGLDRSTIKGISPYLERFVRDSVAGVAGDEFAGDQNIDSEIEISRCGSFGSNLKKRLNGSQLDSEIDSELMQAGITLAGYHIEKGARTFISYAKAMHADLGDFVKPYLKMWYVAIKFDPSSASFANDMDSVQFVENTDIDSYEILGRNISALSLKNRLDSSPLNSEIDPEILAIGAELAAFHIEAGSRSFVKMAKAIANDLGVPVSSLKKYLRVWYNGARDMMEDGGVSIDGMDDADTVRDSLSQLELVACLGTDGFDELETHRARLIYEFILSARGK